MTPKEKAKELFDKMTLACNDIDCHHSLVPYIKQCALIAIDELIMITPFYSTGARSTIEQIRANDNQFSSYWEQVSEEIKNL